MGVFSTQKGNALPLSEVFLRTCGEVFLHRPVLQELSFFDFSSTSTSNRWKGTSPFLYILSGASCVLVDTDGTGVVFLSINLLQPV